MFEVIMQSPNTNDETFEVVVEVMEHMTYEKSLDKLKRSGL